MTERIKLTEDKFSFNEDTGKIEIEIKDENDLYKPNPIIKQILENQKIVDELIKCYSECRSRQENLAISEFETNQQSFMEKLYKRATGKELKEILTHRRRNNEE